MEVQRDTLKFTTDYLEQAEGVNLKRTLRDITPLSPRECLVDGVKCLNFSSNDYLSLSNHPLLKERHIEWTRKFGAGSTASRLVCGTYSAYSRIEETIAEWKGSEAALILGSGYLANVGVIAALLDRASLVVADRLNHASLNAGCQLSRARFRRFGHLDYLQLERLLERKDENRQRTLIVSDTVFSMDGDFADVAALRETAHRHDAILYLDDAHGTGVFGDDGSGLARGSDADVVMGTFSKAMGSYGAYVACPREVRDYLVNRCGSFIYSTALPPGVYGSIEAAVELVRSSEFEETRRRLLSNAAWVRSEFHHLGLESVASQSPIIPIIVGEPEMASRMSRMLLENGILSVAIRPPTVPKGSARIRVSLNAAHTREDLARLVAAVDKAARSLLPSS